MDAQVSCGFSRAHIWGNFSLACMKWVLRLPDISMHACTSFPPDVRYTPSCNYVQCSSIMGLRIRTFLEAQVLYFVYHWWPLGNHLLALRLTVSVPSNYILYKQLIPFKRLLIITINAHVYFLYCSLVRHPLCEWYPRFPRDWVFPSLWLDR